MAIIKKLDLFILKSYIGPLIATFFISLFVLLMQFLWKYIDDLVGKGLDVSVIAELMLYASAGLIPMALPLAILLASIMTFGNLGERFELTAIKASGISLQRTMAPLIWFSVVVSFSAFFISNNAIPYTNLKMSALLYSIKTQRPEMNIKPGVFNNDLENYSIRINDKNPVTNMMYGFMAYEHSSGLGNTTVTLADSGSMKITDDNRYMLIDLYNGIRYEEMQNSNRNGSKTYPQRTDSFSTQTVVFSLAGFDFSKTDENLFKNNYQVKNIDELKLSIDSLYNSYNQRIGEFENVLFSNNYLKNAKHDAKEYADSLRATKKFRTRLQSNNMTVPQNLTIEDSSATKEDSAIAKLIDAKSAVVNRLYSVKPDSLKVIVDLDSLYDSMDDSQKAQVLNRIKEYASETQSTITQNSEDFLSRKRTIAKYRNAWHQKFTLSIACLIFFFIGAPLGAIIRKGGFGLPIVISIFVFIVYYVISMAGMKMSRESVWEPWLGMWLSSIVILPLGVFLTYKATVDAQLFNFDAYLEFFTKIGHALGFVKKKKEVWSKFEIKTQSEDASSNSIPEVEIIPYDAKPLVRVLNIIAAVLIVIGIVCIAIHKYKTSMLFGGIASGVALLTFFVNKRFALKQLITVIAFAVGLSILVSAFYLYKQRRNKVKALPQTEQTSSIETKMLLNENIATYSQVADTGA